MPIFQNISYAWKAWLQMGTRQVGFYGLYRLGMITGWWRLRTPVCDLRGGKSPGLLRSLLALPEAHTLKRILGAEGLERLRSEADEIVSGKVRLFGSQLTEIKLDSPGGLPHWTRYPLQQSSESIDPQDDIRWIWEYGRFGWAICLARAYYLFKDERYCQAFWKYCELFLENNPPNRGVHWTSGQEVALRCISLVFVWQVFKDSAHTGPKQVELISQAIARHAERIPPTLIYARAQANNHLLSESAGLYTAGLALPDHPDAALWRKLGWKWFNHGLMTQITRGGEYCQFSSNYQRLMLQLAVWVGCAAAVEGKELPKACQEKLQAATLWLSALCEPSSGSVPNLGANDGSNFLPLNGCSIEDYRPILQAATLAFNHRTAFTQGAWDEEACWLGMGEPPYVNAIHMQAGQVHEIQNELPAILRLQGVNSWAYLRYNHYDTRPSHADQLHLDLWWQGINIAKDAGSYLYNAAPPWNNALRRTTVHNTLIINGLDQMKPAGRFLWLDWAQGRQVNHSSAEDGAWERLVASHDGYRELGVEHRRILTAHHVGRWEVLDQVLAVDDREVRSLEATVQWLLPDWKWEVTGKKTGEIEIQIHSPQGSIGLSIHSRPLPEIGSETSWSVQLVRAGKLIYGKSQVEPICGWESRTYGYKKEALSVKVSVQGKPPLEILSTWIL